MRGNYPDPFASGLGNACKLTCAAILGPCYAATIERKDITEGHDGLPVRLAFVIVDESCQPIPGAVIDIWHVSPRGVYSGNDSVTMCTLDDPEALTNRWFRGTQTTDARGRADFDSCFPGWYSGRTIHIHFTIRLGATEYLTSQLYFDDAVSDDITTTQPIYCARGVRDTTNKTDGVIAASALPDYSFQVARMPDGAMLASKAIVIRSQIASQLCDTPGGDPGGGRDGGFPPFDGSPPDGFGGFPPRDAGQEGP
jgi:protocatechuate 3,4-dioxygenase beta subunit